MRSRRGIVVILILLGALIFVNQLMAKEKAEEVALGVSDKWLNLVDKGDYSKSWERTAEIFKTMVPKGEWEAKLNTFRAPLGKVSERKVKSKQYTTTISDAPQGEYVVFEYETVFKNRQAITETVVTVLEKDGKWRVGGYHFIPPGREPQPSAEKKKE